MSFCGALLALAVFGESGGSWSNCEVYTLGNDCDKEVVYCNGYCAEACDESYDLVWETHGAYCAKCPEGSYHLYYENSYQCLRALPATKVYGGDMNLVGACDTSPYWNRDFVLGGCFEWTCPMEGTYLNWPAYNPSHSNGVMEPVCVGGDILAECPPGATTSTDPSGEIVCHTGLFKSVEGNKNIMYHSYSYGGYNSETSACGEDYWTFPSGLCCEAGFLTHDMSEDECGPWVCFDWGLDVKTSSCPCSNGWSCDVYDATVLPEPIPETYYAAEKTSTFNVGPFAYEATVAPIMNAKYTETVVPLTFEATVAPLVNAKYQATVAPVVSTYTTAPIDTAYTYTVDPVGTDFAYEEIVAPAVAYTETVAPLTATGAYTETFAPDAYEETVPPAIVGTTYTETFEPMKNATVGEYDNERGCYFDPVLGSGCVENQHYCDGYCSEGCDEGFSLLSQKENVAGVEVYGMVCEACPQGYAHIWTEDSEYQCIKVIPGLKAFGGYQNRIGMCREDPYWYKDGKECYTWECDSGFQTVWPMCSDMKNCHPICADPAEVLVGEYCPVGMEKRIYEWKTSQTICVESTDEVNVGVTEVLFHKYSDWTNENGCDEPYPQDMCCEETEDGNSMYIYRDQSEIDCGPWICFDWTSEETGTPYPCENH